jgi:type I restriction-modification system DNA methylase subunit
MNTILHDTPTALIEQGNSLANPKFLDGDTLKTFDYVVANPPFSDKRWSNGIDPLNDPHDRFNRFGTPPDLAWAAFLGQTDKASMMEMANALAQKPSLDALIDGNDEDE